MYKLIQFTHVELINGTGWAPDVSVSAFKVLILALRFKVLIMVLGFNVFCLCLKVRSLGLFSFVDVSGLDSKTANNKNKARQRT